jgi:diketogulonate reductase-like aldo/keto reductase
MKSWLLKNTLLYELPKFGLGTWQIPPGEMTFNATKDALSNGYRLIDTAAGYQNEKSVGKAIKYVDISIDEVFISTKLESHIKTYQGALDAFEASLEALDMDYVDLYLIHAPWPWSDIGSNHDQGNIEAWNALETIYKSGRAKAIGVSNFSIKDLENIIENSEIIPMVNQISLFIGNPQIELVDYCQKLGIHIMGYSPLAIGYALNDPFVLKMAHKYQVTPAQLLIRYVIERGAIAIPKTTNIERMIENKNVDFEIHMDDMILLNAYENDPRKWE